MLASERKKLILEYINENRSVSAFELTKQFDSSEATIRRDLTEMDKQGLISKVHGGAISKKQQITQDYNVSYREELNKTEKTAIARFAASLIKDGDFVFLDAGTTTNQLIDFIKTTNITVVTHSVSHAKKLSALGFEVYLPAGKLKGSTEAIVGSQCYETISKYNFNIAFIGANAVNHKGGFMTPDLEEAKIKECAMKKSGKAYVLCDYSKFDVTSSVTFAEFEEAEIITAGDLPKQYKKDKNIISISL